MNIRRTTLILAIVTSAVLACGAPHDRAACPFGEQLVGDTCTPPAPPEKKAPISEFFAQPDRRSAGQKFVEPNLNPGFCYSVGSLSFAQSTFSQSQTDALATAGSLPVGPGWFLVVSTADGATWRATCSSPWELSRTSFELVAPASCQPDSGAYKPGGVGQAYLSLGHRDESGELVHSCAKGGSIVLESAVDGTVTVTLNAQMSDDSFVTDALFEVPDLF